MELGQGLKHMSYEECQGSWRCLAWRKADSGGTLSVCKYLKGHYRWVGFSFFSRVKTVRTRGNCLKLHERRFVLDIMKNFFTGRVVKHLNKRPRKGLESPFLEMLRTCFSGDYGGGAGLVVRCDELKSLILRKT